VQLAGVEDPAGIGRQRPWSTRYRWAAGPSAALWCGAATLKNSSADAVRRSGVPFTNSLTGGRPAR